MINCRRHPSPFLMTTAIIVLFLTSANIHAQDDEPIRVDSSIVLLNVAVTDKVSMAVDGLERRNFRVFEDGVEQEISLFEAEETPFAAVILLDTSGSMEDRVSIARSAAIQFLNGMRLSDSAAVMKFDSKVELIRDFSNQPDLNERFFALRSGGMTLLNDAILKAAEMLADRPEKRRAIVVLSDGADTQSRSSADKALRAAIGANASIYTVDMSALNAQPMQRAQGIGPLKNFAEKSGGAFVSTPGGVALREAFKRVAHELGQQYTVAYSPKNAAKDGKWRSIEVRVDRPNLTIRTRKGYNADKAQK